MGQRIRIIAGLGNPGVRYSQTRHNAGFALADRLAALLKPPCWKTWLDAGEIAKTEHNGAELLLLKPLTYMNRSGEVVCSFANYHKIAPGEILVCFDDLSIAVGGIRLRRSGSSGGQLGMQNIIDLSGTNAIPRLRIGIGPKPAAIDSKDFVLSKFAPDEKPAFASAVETAAAAALMAVESGLESAMNKFNGGQ